MVGELPNQPYLTAETLGEPFELGPPERYLGCRVTADLTNLVQKISLLLGHQIDPRRAVEFWEVEPQDLSMRPRQVAQYPARVSRSQGLHCHRRGRLRHRPDRGNLQGLGLA